MVDQSGEYNVQVLLNIEKKIQYMLHNHEIVYPPPRDSSVSNLIFQSSTSRKPSQPFRTKAG